MKKTILVLSILLISSVLPTKAQFNVQKNIDYCAIQAKKTISTLPPDGQLNIPRSINKDSKTWRLVDYQDWCSGFWSGSLWYLYEGTKKPFFKTQAERFDKQLLPLSTQKVAYDHDLGFQIFCSYGNGYRLTKNPSYKKVILNTANVLATLYNPKVGTILSWPREVQKFGAHNTIIDNMINLELLFWASKNGGNKNLYKMAETHALTTMKNHFRDDYTSYHVVLYDTLTGKKIRGITHQGYADHTMWARGQSWAIYGFTMCYRETKNPKFLDFAQKVTDVYLKNLPDESLIPFWDFNAPDIPNTTRDASAAAVTASALFELSTLVKDKKKSALYYAKAKKMLESLSTTNYQSGSVNDAFLLHSTGNVPIGGEIDASIIYADYYYIEALLRYKKMNQKK
ncbi:MULTISPECIES: glycoside hydrolase family 88 protein [unclassified Arcicella]|uniref:glycoside hydrolase family 88 protein n=1 Tax=unclassified Arcicella TaxID=2644986 RepID=UPI0028569983|nr:MULTISPECIES: glycoside hydrolase family 88 protein [unclassified Arcicella]MDR6564746.1 unsaturated chondroitin disaccharide hydrolase [Arcicella sp. BE51]MDR6814542.1 unsaturated chondroitin disaccharide hydrolase [Arcicella sp. BE140]MDR6825870.1 unsaturated chondroitin disaccharide hydrolase [Arcicella sp. BE139]